MKKKMSKERNAVEKLARAKRDIKKRKVHKMMAKKAKKKKKAFA